MKKVGTKNLAYGPGILKREDTGEESWMDEFKEGEIISINLDLKIKQKHINCIPTDELSRVK